LPFTIARLPRQMPVRAEIAAQSASPLSSTEKSGAKRLNDGFLKGAVGLCRDW